MAMWHSGPSRQPDKPVFSSPIGGEKLTVCHTFSDLFDIYNSGHAFHPTQVTKFGTCGIVWVNDIILQTAALMPLYTQS